MLIIMKSLLALVAFLVAAATALDSSSDDVIELSDANFDTRVIQSQELWIVEFYSPRCGYSKNLDPEWKTAATALKGFVNVAAVDATVHQALCGRFQVQRFPSIKIFGSNKNNPTDYQDARSASAIVDAAISQLNSIAKSKLSGSSSSGTGGGQMTGDSKDIVELTDSNFESLVLQSQDWWLVNFYNPSCEHCKNLAPHFASAATELKGKVKLGALDATVNTFMASRYGVQRYPTIKMFPSGPKQGEVVDYDGGRTSCDIVTWCLAKLTGNVPSSQFLVTGDSKDVVELTDSNFESLVLQSEDWWMVEFYDNQNLAPQWSSAATELKGKVKFGALDATVNSEMASRYGVQRYPTIIMICNGPKKGEVVEYNGGRTSGEIVSWTIHELDGNVRSSQVLVTAYSKDVVELTDSNFESLVLQSQDWWMVHFYDPSCEYCQNLAPHWSSAATELKGKVKFGALDATVNTFIASRYGVHRYPTIIMFCNGPKKGEVVEYDGGRTSGAIVTWAIHQLDGNVRSSQFLVTGDSKDVVELTDSNFESLVLQSEDWWMVEFYDNQNLAPQWSSAATELKGKVKFGALDATVNSEMASRYGVQRYPTIIMICNGPKKGEVVEYNGGRTSGEIVSWTIHELAGNVPSSQFLVTAYSKDVVELTDSNFESLVLQSDDWWMVDFYDPSCEYCQILAPHWGSAATELKGKVRFGALDATVNTFMASRYGVHRYPTIIMFCNGPKKGEVVEYNGGRTSGEIVSWTIHELAGNVPSSQFLVTGDSKDVVELTDSNFESLVLQSDDWWMVEFYDQSCEHCQNLAPHWASAATELKGKVKFGALDATVNTFMASRYGVQRYPTIIMFCNGPKKGEVVEYNGGRTSGEIVTWALNKLDGNVRSSQVFVTGDSKDVVELTDSNFESLVLQSEDWWLVEFYDQSCEHCQNLAPHFASAATELKGKVKFGALDATVNSVMASRYGVQRYPTIIMFCNGPKKGEVIEYNGGRTSGEIVAWCLAKLAGNVPSSQFLVTGDSRDVVELTDSNFESLVLQSEDWWLVNFYDQSCEHCQNLVPHFASAATELKGKVRFGALDATVNSVMASRYGVQRYPTIIMFCNGPKKGEVIEYNGGRTSGEIVAWCLAKLAGNVPSSQFLVTGDSRDVVELTDSNFESLVLQSQDWWLVNFYNPSCEHCKNLAPHFASAATELKGKVRFGALDATVNTVMASRYRVQRYPTIIMFCNGPKKGEVIEYNGGRTSGEIVAWCLAKLAGTGDSSDVVELTDSNFESLVLQSEDWWLVNFYDPSCEHCKNLAPHFASAARELKGKVKFGALDATVNTIMASRYRVQRYPTIIMFCNGPKKGELIEYDGGRTSGEIVAWCLAKLAGTGDSKGVVQLTDSNFDSLVLQSGDLWLVEFYAPYCGHCKNWASAATNLKGNVKLGALDATVNTVMASRYGVQGYPTMKLFSRGPEQGEVGVYNDGRASCGIVDWALERFSSRSS